ncbi:cobaltochelatase [Skermanella stibiiresistens SB22]|uniref:Cobaltochelatase subunit CobN n=1 Tax=Skermanella stibiiresistens SB22 TaxID=1385369 RepID=W9H6F3_9PROT|nr:cobaltochelatase subunit CobN [Skermanella stibiiresistens]EWY40277.1 cobaltochelatase [Skermanella stibiiresistens SB22]
MHLLAAQPGTISDGGEAVDLGQTPGDIVFLSAADTELACLAAAHDRLGADFPTLRLASLLQLGHNLSIDLHVERVVARAKLVVVRLLGGQGYWPYGIEQVADACRRGGIPLAVLPGDDQPDPELARFSTLPADATHRLWRYCVQGGVENATGLLRYAASLIGANAGDWREPVELMRAGIHWPGRDRPGLDDLRDAWIAEAPVAAILFYRALEQAANTAVIDALIASLRAAGVNALPIATTSLKEKVAAGIVADLLARASPDVILNATSFAVSQPGAARSPTPFDGADCPVLQVVFSGGSEAAWRSGTTGLSARDIAMNVALPEVDGRLISRAVSFKAEARRHEATQSWVLSYKPVTDRVDFVAALAASWARLRRTPAAERRVAIVLANYPNRDGRLANGVGLDTPAGVTRSLRALADAGYRVVGAPDDPAALMALLGAGVTNDLGGLDQRAVSETLRLDDYVRFFDALPEAVRAAVATRWGPPEADPFVRNGRFLLPAIRFGNVAVAIQPARGYQIDPSKTYHDPDLVPPHAYLACYAWIRLGFDADAVVHFGKHGNLEWLPGKSLALSEECFPEVALGPIPHLYPFIVNDPGEGTQAKRRAAAVIIDHLTPPLTRAESYGPLRELEMLVDEYYEAAGVDPRRITVLRERILDLSAATGLNVDCGVGRDDEPQDALAKLDSHLCELKELQIRDGLHIFGESPEGEQLTDLLVALTRLARGKGVGRDASLIRALAADLDLDFDPLDCAMAEPWRGARPAALADDGVWRSTGDTVERLELLARGLVAGETATDPAWERAGLVLDYIQSELRPTVRACGAAELDGLLRGLDGRFVEPGPSGAPTRGRPEVLPTGRNFYSVDTRAVPTPAAWHLGWKSASRVVERYLQENGDWPRTMALSAWGTANMRTGGDDIAQALALMGARPTWDTATGRVTGFEIMPAGVLDRPRVDVTLRVSGFFRDAFPAQMDLVDSAARAIADLDEPDDINPLAARVRADAAALVADGADPAAARRRAGHRVFGSKPGAYGAGLQALIDERGWETDQDLSDAYLAWGGYAYGGGVEGAAERGLFETRLGAVQAVLHNQDNREHDLLDSDDYYQFEGGMAVAVRTLSGRAPTVYHNDHSRPESPKVRTLDEEIARVVRGRVVNPKWIAGIMRHGYKGAFELSATVDYLFAFAATARCVRDHHFDAVFDAYVGDANVRDFMAEANPAALREMAERLAEAQDRGLWRPKSNAAYDTLKHLSRGEAP